MRIGGGTPGFGDVGVNGYATTKDPKTGKLDSTVFPMIDDRVDSRMKAKRFTVVRADRLGKKFLSETNMLKLDTRLPELGDTFSRELYWPAGSVDHPIPRTETIIGMAPIYNSINEVTKWLIARQTATGIEYLMGVEKFGNSARPVEVLKRLDELDVYDDIYFFGRSNDYAVVPKGSSGVDLWRINYNVGNGVVHSTSATYPSGPAAYAGLQAAIKQGEVARRATWEREKKKHAETTEKIERLLGAEETTSRIVECEMVRSYAKKKASSEAVTRKWLTINQLDSYRACQHIPVSLYNSALAANTPTGITPPTLSQQLQAIQRAIANEPTVLKCTTNSSGIETCKWVN